MKNQFNKCNGLQEIIDKALDEMKQECGGHLDLDKINLADFCRKTSLTRSKARTLKKNRFKVKKHGRSGYRAKNTVMSGHESVADTLLCKGVTNSSVIFDALRKDGYTGGLTSVKDYIKAHMSLVPAKRKINSLQSNRGIRYQTDPGKVYQMDWGFVKVRNWKGDQYRIACFAMICHHCGRCYIEFFTNARQENLFIGMIHAFMVLGVAESVLTDNMKSVVVGKDIENKPIWQVDYANFMTTIGFKTKLCKPRHPFTKGKVERLIRFVKENFLAGRTFQNITQLNQEALLWCQDQGSRYRKSLDLIPLKQHQQRCLLVASALTPTEEIARYLCPLRKISFDGFICYEGRRFGVPYFYTKRLCRVNREGDALHIYDENLSYEIVAYPITWSKKDRFCVNQYSDNQPIEFPTTEVETTIRQLKPPATKSSFSKFDFERRCKR